MIYYLRYRKDIFNIKEIISRIYLPEVSQGYILYQGYIYLRYIFNIKEIVSRIYLLEVSQLPEHVIS